LFKCFSGLSSAIAQNIIDYREENGAIKHNKEISKVKRLSSGSEPSTIRKNPILCSNVLAPNRFTLLISLLCLIAGLSSAIAQNIIDYREENGAIKHNKEISKVKRLGLLCLIAPFSSR
jgi:transcriptional accessory protein Tex/SPT6